MCLILSFRVIILKIHVDKCNINENFVRSKIQSDPLTMNSVSLKTRVI